MAAKRRKRLLNKKLPAASRKRTGHRKPESIISTVKKKWSERRPVLLFLVVFAALMGLFYAFILFTPFYERHSPYYLSLNARLSGCILKFLGQDITVAGISIYSPGFSVSIQKECDAIDPIVLFICAVLAFPTPFFRKVPGIIAGTLLLVALNLIRIVSLFLAGEYLPRLFDILHLELWQGLFIISAVVSWVFWLLWATQRQIQVKHTRN